MTVTVLMLHNKYYCYDPLLAGTVTVVCNQTNKVISVKVGDLSKDDGNLAAEDLETPGTQLLLSEKGREYPVTLITKPQKKRKADTVRAPPSKRIQEELASSDSEVKLRSQKCIVLRPSYARQELGQRVSYSSQQHFAQSISKVFSILLLETVPLCLHGQLICCCIYPLACSTKIA